MIVPVQQVKMEIPDCVSLAREEPMTPFEYLDYRPDPAPDDTASRKGQLALGPLDRMTQLSVLPTFGQ